MGARATRGAARRSTFLLLLIAGQGAYYVLTGIWPILHIESFMAVTGPKIDLWLVKTVGVLVAGSGGVFLYSAWLRRLMPEVLALALANALGLALVDIIYVGLGRIAPIYLGDAAVEIGLVVCLAAGWRHAREGDG